MSAIVVMTSQLRKIYWNGSRPFWLRPETGSTPGIPDTESAL
jgi:hypothetical protein